MAVRPQARSAKVDFILRRMYSLLFPSTAGHNANIQAARALRREVPAGLEG